MNPAGAPVIILALTSPTRTPQRIYDEVANVIQQRVSQVRGVGDVEIGGGSLPAVRVSLNPLALGKLGISSDDVRAAIQSATANRPKGALEGALEASGDAEHPAAQDAASGGADRIAADDRTRRLQIYTRNTGRNAAEYRDLVIAWRNGAPVRLADVAQVSDGPEDRNTLGLFNGEPAVIVLISRQPDANIIETVDAVRALVPQLQAQLPPDIELRVASDRTNSIRASLREIELTLLISVLLVVAVVSLFLRSVRATAVPAVATVVSLLGTFGVMHLLGFSLNNLSLMALTVATGFVVDDAIVVLENISRHLEAGKGRIEAALAGAREVGFTVLAISLSLVAVFIPLLFMGGQIGMLFREFAVTLSAAVMISLVVSLTTTPMMCALLLRPGRRSDALQRAPARAGRLARLADGAWRRTLRGYAAALDWALHAPWLVLLILVAVMALNVWLFIAVPKGFFPQQDAGQLSGGLRTDRSISFQAFQGKLRELVRIIKEDPAVDTVVGFAGGSRAGSGFLFVNLKPLAERGIGGQAVVARLRPKLAQVSGVMLFLNPVQDLRGGGRSSNSTYQYTLKSDNEADLRDWAMKLAERMKQSPQLLDVDTDQEQTGVEAYVAIDRATARQLGVTPRDVDTALYNAFGQRQVATLYDELNQYKVVMEVDPRYAQSPLALADVMVAPSAAAGTASTAATAATAATTTTASTATSANAALRDASTGQAVSTTAQTMVPLSAIARFAERGAEASISHDGGELATTISYNLPEGVTLGDAAAAIAEAEAAIGMPNSVRGATAGNARAFEQSQGQQPLLILAALVVIYIVLGILYESLIHPITVLSTLPAAGVGAVLALLLMRMDFSLIALIGLFLLIGIVKKNAILIIDFALEAERARGLSAFDAVREASLLRLRPILMTTLAAGLGALPLAIGFGEGAELRQPLGIAIIGGLVASQLLTLLTTPVVYLLLDRLRRRGADERHLSRRGAGAPPVPTNTPPLPDPSATSR